MKGIVGLALLWLAGCASMPAPQSPPPEPTAQVDALANRLVALQLGYDPTWAYFTGLPAPDHHRWADRSPPSLEALYQAQTALLADLRRIDAAALPEGPARVTYALVREQLESSLQLRACRWELWDVSHMRGWHLQMVEVAQQQPVGTADERAQALVRWRGLPAVVDREIANLRRGLDQGYSSPRTVVARVIKQIDGLAAAPAGKSPLFSPGERATDAAFKAAFAGVIREQVNPALARYRDFLKTEYLPRAREALGVSANPQGAACYQAGLRGFTTLNRTPQEVYDLGRRTVEANTATVQALGERKWGVRDLPTILKRINDAPDNHFASEPALIDFSREAVTRARAKSTTLFHALPAQEVRVEPFREFMRGSGASSHYEQDVDAAKPAYYRIASEQWATETRGGAEITAVHEAYPGHHLQIAFARTLPQTDIAKMSFNSAYAEGWGRYAEQLAEEAGMYVTDYAPMTRRMWPARGMVADPGLHVLGWSRKQVVDYLMESGRFSPQDTEDLIDRMAVMPGQLTAYDSGALQIVALRAEAERELGARFDVRDFHRTVLELGAIPLSTLADHVRAWIAREKAR
jgi:uncharacterized protein (DUF885 family)